MGTKSPSKRNRSTKTHIIRFAIPGPKDCRETELMIDFKDTPQSINPPIVAIVIGASGALGQAFVAALCADSGYTHIFAVSRSGQVFDDERVQSLFVDLEDETSIAQAAATCAGAGPCHLLINAVGVLHGPADIKPEKALKELDGVKMAKLFALNTIGPALVLKYFSPIMVKDGRSIMATLSARVGSISDNHLGGWYSYRATKAALNQIIKTTAIELGMRRKHLICVGLHPGTVRSAMSEPFIATYKANEIFSPEFAAHCLLDVLAGLQPEQSGRIIAWDGQEIAP
jgi:NAD(P)-dependent dehydrogenase (short-subunit alcohol dehydrogenase family)